MSIRIAHISDTHDNPRIVRQVANCEADIILITGDCMATHGRVPDYRSYTHSHRIDHGVERRYQRSWFRKQAKKWAPDFKGRPVVAIRGNHDFIGYTKWLEHYGADVHEITDATPMVEVLGIRFAGFRQINHIAGEWTGEEFDLRPFVEKALACDPNVLVTHAPPGGILDEGYGISELTTPLFYGEHRITHHFFGHSHYAGGLVLEEGGIKFVNGAGHCIVHEVG